MKTNAWLRGGAALLCFATIIGCGGEQRQPVFPVTGKVLIQGKPAKDATVIFHPVGKTGTEAVKPRAKVAEDGSFTLTTYEGNDGAPAGDYQVTVELWLAKGDEGPVNRLPFKFSRPESSTLNAKVNSEPTKLNPIEVRY